MADLNYFPLIMVSVKLKHDIIVLICFYFILLLWHYFTKYSIRFVKWDWQLLKKEQISKELLTCHFTSLWPVNLYSYKITGHFTNQLSAYCIRQRFVSYIHTCIHAWRYSTYSLIIFSRLLEARLKSWCGPVLTTCKLIKINQRIILWLILLFYIIKI